MKNTYKELELVNGEVVKLTLNFAKLLKIKNENKEIYEKFMKVLQSQEFDVIIDSLVVLYTAYLCGNLQEKQLLSEDEFYELLEFDLAKINILAGELIQGKKK